MGRISDQEFSPGQIKEVDDILYNNNITEEQLESTDDLFSPSDSEKNQDNNEAKEDSETIDVEDNKITDIENDKITNIKNDIISPNAATSDRFTVLLKGKRILYYRLYLLFMLWA